MKYFSMLLLWSSFALAAFAQDAEFYFNEAGQLMNQHKYEAAIQDLQKAIDIQRQKGLGYPKGYMGLGNCFLELGNWDEAIKSFDVYINADPLWFPAFMGRGRAKCFKADYLGALLDASAAISIQPNNAMAHNLCGQAYFGLANFQGAVDEFTKAIQIKPNEENYSFRAISYIQLPSLKEAIADATMSIDFHTSDFTPHMTRASARYRSGDNSGALEDVTHAIELKADIPDLYILRAQIKYALKDFPGMTIDCDKALSLRHDYAGAYFWRANARLELKDYAGALADLNIAAQLSPKDPSVFNNLGYVKMKLKNYSEAITDFDKAINLQIDYANSYRHRGNCKRELGRVAEAIADLESANIFNTNYPDAAFDLGMTYLKMDAFKNKACEWLTKAKSMGQPDAAAALQQNCQ
jgi:tetratricopeptide (TPR) repeat protein